MFCPKCGSLLLPKKEGNKVSMSCKCGFKTSDTQGTKLTETTHKKRTDIEVVDTDFETLPLTDAMCPKCKHPKAFTWGVQTRSADESETKFFRCEKCKHTWRDYN